MDKPDELKPGVHPTPHGRYSYRVGDDTVHADAAHVGDMLASGLRTWDDPLVADLLRFARSNPDIADDERALLPWALTAVSAHSPSAIGLVGRAAYSGPRTTSLIGNLRHRARGYAFAAELVTAAALIYRSWPASDGAIVGDAYNDDARLDFGVKLIGAGTRSRTIEADVLISHPDGRRVAVDVKASRAGAYRTAPSVEILQVIDQAVARGEITSFHFVTRRRFRPSVHRAVAGASRIHLHEHVWPSDADRRASAGVTFRRSCPVSTSTTR